MLTAQNRSVAPLDDDPAAASARVGGTPTTQQPKAAPAVPQPVDPGGIGAIGGGGVAGTAAPASAPPSGVQPLDMSGGVGGVGGISGLGDMAGATLAPTAPVPPPVAPPVAGTPGIEAAPSDAAANSQIGLQPATIAPAGTPSAVQPLGSNPTGPTAPTQAPMQYGTGMPNGFTWADGSPYLGAGSYEGETAAQFKTANDAAQLAAVDAGGDKGMQALYHDPTVNSFAGKDVQYGADGSVMDAKTGALLKGPDSGLAQTIAKANTPTSTYTPPSLGPADYLVGGQHYGNFADAQNAETPAAGPSASPAGGTSHIGIPASARDTATPSSFGGATGQIAPPGTPGPSVAPSGTAALGPSSSGSGAGTASTITGNPVLDSLLSSSGGTSTPSLTNTDPNNALTTKTIGAPSQNDPVQMALAAYNTFRQQTDPQYQADLTRADRMAAGAGSIGSGQLNTSLGNIANARQNTLSTEEQGLLNGALGTQNENAYRNTGIAQQQQGFQQGQQDTAFNQALQQAMYGSQGDPSQLGLALSAIFGQQANQAGSNLGSLISGSTQNGSTQALIEQLLGGLNGGGGTGSGAGAGAVDPKTQAILDGILNGGVPPMQTTGSY